jgi:hypothetical protein
MPAAPQGLVRGRSATPAALWRPAPWWMRAARRGAQVAFKSEWLQLAGAAEAAMGELLFTRDALAEVRGHGAAGRLAAWSSAHWGWVALGFCVQACNSSRQW